MQTIPSLRGALGFLALTIGCAASEFPGTPPGEAQVSRSDAQLTLGNDLLSVHWSSSGAVLRAAQVQDVRRGGSFTLADNELFELWLANGRILFASDFRLVDAPEIQELEPSPSASVLSSRVKGRQLVAHLRAPDAQLDVEWRAILRDGANAIRQEFVFQARQEPIAVQRIRLIDLAGAEAKLAGSAPGNPLLQGNFFFAYEHPDAQGQVGHRATMDLSLGFGLRPKQPVTQSAVIGIAPPGQMRRGFLYYVERERAHPYRPFLHYNAWYDICWGDRKITEGECLAAVDAFKRELFAKRGLTLDSFVWDDGWDDPKTLWRPIDRNFPQGFTNVLAAARACESTLGFWLSPFGGYGTAKEERLSMGKSQGFEIGPQGFSLAGPRYYERFLETCSRFVRTDGANFFKFDGLARSVDETEAMLRLTRALRALKPDLFISITTGTWPSPFWLWYGDSTWRGGGDMGFAGVGSRREQWITYRDAETYRNVVQPAPLYPLNSLMTQGFPLARHGTAQEVGREAQEVRRELRSFFASGTCLQELYVTPEMMSDQNWDDLAECAKWARSNADVLVDTHWVGGDPNLGEPYGWASWSPRKAVLALRNPGDGRNVISIDVGHAFELPPTAPKRFVLKSPWTSDSSRPGISLTAGQAHQFELAPFEVVVFDATPLSPSGTPTP